MTSRLAILATLLATAASLGLLWLTNVPLGVPGEWTWARLNYAPPAFVWGVTVAGTAGGLYVAFGWITDRRLAAASRLEVACWLALLVAVGFGWLTAVQSAAIEGLGLAKAPHVLFYRRTEGYFWQARYEVESVPDFLAGYESLMAERDYLHIGTHPPGLTLLYGGMLDLCRSSPRLVDFVESTQPETVTRTLDLIRDQQRAAGEMFERADAACLWLAALMTQLAAALTVVPMSLWLRVSASRTAVWRTVLFWPLIPSVAVFLPKSDVLYPLLAMTAAWLFRSAWFRCRERLSIFGLLAAMLGSLVLWCGMLLSLAFLTVFALIGMQAVCDAFAERSQVTEPHSRTAWLTHQLTIAVAFVGVTLMTLGGVLSLFGDHGMNLLTVWQWNFSNHALFYEHNVRTWWKWLLLNPLELTLAVGVPVVALAKWGSLARLRDWRGWLASPVLPFTLVWMLLWLSGKNMGEAARLWIIVMPWLVGCAANAFRERDQRSEVSRVGCAHRRWWTQPTLRSVWLMMLTLQFIACGLTTLRIDGFHFTDLLLP